MDIENETLVNVKLTTKYERYQIGTSAIAVPTRFSRSELSKLVNEALELEKPIPFDFIIGGILLRVPLSEYISLHGLSLESTLVLEYVPIIGKPEEKSSEDLPDWLGGLSSIENYYVAGCYDGSLHIYDSTDSLLASSIAHKKPIKSVDLQKYQDDVIIASTSLDNTIRLTKLSQNTLQPIATCSGHDSHVLCCKFHPESPLLVTGAWNGSILVWNVSTVSTVSTNEVEPVHTLSEGVSGVTALGWSQNRVISGGWDHVLRIWDLEMEGVVNDLKGNKVINALDVQAGSQLIATAHPDGAVRLWDARQEKPNVLTFASQKQFGSVVRWHPTQSTIVSAMDYAGSVTVFDTRSTFPIHIAEHVQEGKILCGAWKNGEVLLSGGEDKKLRRLSVARGEE